MPDDAEQWLCLTPYWHQAADGHAYLSGMLRDITAGQRYQQNSEKFNAKKNTVLEILAMGGRGSRRQICWQAPIA